MKNLRPETLGILQRIETLSGRPVEFKPDGALTLRATLQLARNGATSHVLRYRPTNEPLDYWVAYQAGYLLRLLEARGMLRFHEVDAIRRRTRWLVAQHFSAVIRERADGAARFVVDSWFGEHGEPAVILPLEDWLDGEGPHVS